MSDQEGMGDDLQWIDWTGGTTNPIEGPIEAVRRDGRVFYSRNARNLSWDHWGEISDIVKYRPAPSPTEPL